MKMNGKKKVLQYRPERLLIVWKKAERDQPHFRNYDGAMSSQYVDIKAKVMTVFIATEVAVEWFALSARMSNSCG